MDGQGDEEPPAAPPELALYLKFVGWGDPWGGGWMRWPAREMTRLRYVRNVYEGWSAWRRALAAGKGTEWTRQDPVGNRIKGKVQAFRREGEEVGVVERWEKTLSLALSQGERGQE